MENNDKFKHLSQTEVAVHDSTNTIENDSLGFPVAPAHHGETDMMAPGPLQDPLYFPLPHPSEPGSNDLMSFLSRPFKIGSGPFINGSTTASYATTNFPSDFVTDTGVTPNLTGAFGWRCTICYRVEVAAAPQVQGIVRLVYQYMPPSGNTKINYRALAAQLPGAEINLRSGSACDIRIPYVSDRDFYPLKNGTYTTSTTAFSLALYPYAPVTWDTTTVSTPSFVIYRWFEDIQLISKTTGTSFVTPQSRVAEQDFNKASSWFRLGSTISKSISVVPTLTALMRPVSWALSSAGKVAAQYGFSKPVESGYTGSMHMSTAKGINTCSDTDFANPMGMYSNNETQILPGFAGKDLDEMALCYLTCKPGLVASFNLLATDLADNVKWTCPVTPSSFVFQSSATGFAQVGMQGIGTSATSGDKPGYIPSPIAFFASYFQRWRGNIIFRFKFNTTKFHAGKLLIGYVPGEDVSDGVTIAGFSQAPQPSARYDFQSVIVDLRTTSEIDFLVPFTYPAQWCDTTMEAAASTTGQFGNTGSVFVRILDPLYGPDNVPQTCTVLVEVLSDCGLEFSQPITSQMAPLDPVRSPILVAQSAVSDYAAVVTTGEKINSIKQVMMRPMWFSSALSVGINNIKQALPQYWAYVTFDSSTPYHKPVETAQTIISRFGTCFALQRGSIILRAIPDLVTTADRSFWSSVAFNAYNQLDARYGAFARELTAANFMRFPFYSKNSRMRTGPSTKASNLLFPSPDFKRNIIANVGGNQSACLWGVSAGDDFQMGCFTGCPPCVTLEAGAVTLDSRLWLSTT